MMPRRFNASAHRVFDSTLPVAPSLMPDTGTLPPPAARIVRNTNEAYKAAKLAAADESRTDDDRDAFVKLALLLHGLPSDAKALAAWGARLQEDLAWLRDEGLRQAQEITELRHALQAHDEDRQCPIPLTREPRQADAR